MESRQSNIHSLFESRKDCAEWNTSYPLRIDDWTPYRVHGALSFNGVKGLSFYIHIPFCKQICAFCEYSRIACPNDETQKKYLQCLRQDILSFIKAHDCDITLAGFDIGGGTPTSLSEDNFDYLLDIYDEVLGMCKTSPDFEPSIEGTFNTLSEQKIDRIVSSGIKRLSLGVQSTSGEVLEQVNRQNAQIEDMRHWMRIAWESGIEKINLDLMYGLQKQSVSAIDADLSVLRALKPQQVTLYELRTNMISQKEIPNKSELYDQYSHYFSGLVSLGYVARFGQNTFSVDDSDYGVSSYLRSRMLMGVPYKGFGISAQSMSPNGISYNIGKATNMTRRALSESSFKEEFTYNLPPKELAAKYIAIAAYNGSFSLPRVSELLGIDAWEYYKEEFEYCIDLGLLNIENGRAFITELGFKHYGAVFSLFYAKNDR
jgi:oxygen-independent coproporphyrinogen-3 oxidase